MTGESYVGALVGRSDSGTVSHSYATGEVNGDDRVGILLGRNDDTVSDSYAAGEVSGQTRVGGLIGRNTGTVENSHYNIDEVVINGGNHVTTGGLFDSQYQDWIEDVELDIGDYSDTLSPSGDYYEISSAEGIQDLLGFAWNLEYKFQLAADIDLSDEPNLYIPYLVTEFDGDGYTISNLDIDITFPDNIGMFGYLTNEGGVSNLGLVDVDVNGYYSVGGLVGESRAPVDDSYVTGTVSGEYSVGGLIGDNYDTVVGSYATADVTGGSRRVGGLLGRNGGTLSDSYATGDVNGDLRVGGLVGDNEGGTVETSYATGAVTGESRVGGLVGEFGGWNPELINSYATGEVSGEERVGALVGYSWGAIENSFAAGPVSGDEKVGGLLGENSEGGTVSNCYWDEESTGQTDGVGLNEDEFDAEGLSTSEMQGDSAEDNMAALDFEDIWETVDGDYPSFVWDIVDDDDDDETPPDDDDDDETPPDDDDDEAPPDDDDEDDDDDDDDTPGFTVTLLLLAAVIAVAIYKKKR